MTEEYFDVFDDERIGGVHSSRFTPLLLETVAKGGDTKWLHAKMRDLAECPPKPAQLLREIKKYLPSFVKAFEIATKLLRSVVEENNQLLSGMSERSRKRWSKGEDNLLIEYASKEMSVFEIAGALGRTPAAISTRISKLVGIGKISQEIAGRFIGEINGEAVDGYIDGTLHKNTSATNQEVTA